MGHDYLPDYFYDGKQEKNQALYTFPDGKPEEAQYAGMFVGMAIASFIGGLVTFVADRLWK